MKGYWFVHLDVHNPEPYKAYVAANHAPFRKFGARYLVRIGRFEIPEGRNRARHVVLEFPSFQSAHDCWHASEYQEAMKLRTPHSTADLVIVEGYEGPQPDSAVAWASAGSEPRGYWIARADVRDPEQYKRYAAANATAFGKYGARYLARGGRFENQEGMSRSRNVLIEFPSYRAALDCWKSPEYQAAMQLRKDVSTIDLVVIEGYDGAQP